MNEPLTADLFRAALGRFASGVTVITTMDAKGRPSGLTVSAFSSVSLDPPLVVIAIERSNGCGSDIRQVGRFNVHILSRDQESISRRFSESAPRADPFVGFDRTPDGHGLPRLSGSLALLGCRVTQAIDAGDHTLFLGAVESIEVAEGAPLLYFRGGYRHLESDA